MVRVKRGAVARNRRNKTLKLSKGFRGAHSKLFRTANQQVMKALRYSYSGRKQRKRNFRTLWIIKINVACRKLGITYSLFMKMIKNSSIVINRKMLAHLVVIDMPCFVKILSRARK